MNQLTAHQLFFSRIEAAYSPEKRSGYQVVYSTDGITETDVTEIRKRIQCFQTDGRRYQYFHTSTNKAVITCSAVLPTTDNYRAITDQSGRPGAFIAHCLVISREDFATLEDDPFAILDLESSRDYGGQLFVLDADAMIDIQQANKGAVMLPVIPRNDPKTHSDMQAEGWSPEEFMKLLSLTSSARSLTEDGRSLMMQSAYSQRVLDLLNLLLYLVPQDARWYCTFDTAVDGCLPVPGDFWALVGERRISSSKLIQARIDQQMIEYTPEEAGGNQDPKATYYSAWLIDCLARKGLSEVKRLCRAVQPIALAFERQKPFPARDQLSKEAMDSFLDVHEQRAHDQLLGVLTDTGLDAEYAQSYLDQRWRFVRTTVTESSESYALLKSCASGQIDPENLARLLYRWLVHEGNPVGKWRKLLPFAKKCNWPRFLFLVASRVEPTLPEQLLPTLGAYNKLRDEALQAMTNSPRDFENILDDLFGVEDRALPTSPEYFVNPSSAALLGGALAQDRQLVNRLTSDQWGSLVLQLIKLSAAYTLTPLADQMKRIKPKQAQAILSVIKQQQKQKQAVPMIDPYLIQMLEQAASLRRPPRTHQEE